MGLRAMKKQSQNKPNFRNAKMNENLFATKDYENETTLRLEQNKPKQTQSQNRSQSTGCLTAKTEVRSLP